MRRGGNLAVACVILLATSIVLIALALPVGAIVGTTDYWRQPTGDVAEHLIGGRYFLADQWGWPLFLAHGLGGAGGTNIGMTDSVPLAALIAKLLPGAGPMRPYLPIWLMVCFLLQGPAAVIALWSLGVRRRVDLVLGGGILLFAPVLLARFGHAGLCGQFLPLLALAVAVRPWRTVHLLWLAGLTLVAIGIHAYLFAMVLPMLVVSLAQALWTERIGVARAWLCLGGVGVLCGVEIAAFGYFSIDALPIKSYGLWALNLAAPFTPGASLIFAEAMVPETWSPESFCWPGTGAVLIIVISAIFAGRRGGIGPDCAPGTELRALAGQWPAGLMAFGALILFAASYAVRLGPWLVMGLPTEVVRTAMLTPGSPGERISRLTQMLTAGDWARAVLLLVVVGGFAGLVVVLAWRRRRTRFLWFLAGLLAIAVGLLLVRPGAVLVAISNVEASARFVWLPIYLVMLLGVAGVSRAFPRGWAAALLAVGLCLQVADTQPLWRGVIDSLTRVRGTAVSPELPDAFARARSVDLQPTYLCAYAEEDDAAAHAILLDRIAVVSALASERALPINSVRHSRMSAQDRVRLTQDCAAGRAEAVAHVGDAGRLTLILDGAPAAADARAALAVHPACRVVSVGLLCMGGE